MEWILPENQKGDIFEYILSNRNITDKDRFFNAKREHLHDPFLMHDMSNAVKAIAEAIDKKKKIYIHGDFDVDGVTATAIMWNYLYRDLGADVTPYIPSRFTEGYGLTEESLNKLVYEGAELIITVDCGVKDIELVKKYSDKVDFIITDHHTIRTTKSEDPKYKTDEGKVVGEHLISDDALAVVHPKLGGSYPFTEICGAMVSWKVIQSLNIYLQKDIDVYEYLDLATLGTVCDIMPLIDENRTAVKLGLEYLKNTKNVGLQALMEVAEVNKKEISTYEVGFQIGPRLNAAGRLENAMIALRLLCTQSESQAYNLALELNNLNLKRQKLTEEYFNLAEEQLNQNNSGGINFVYGEGWPEGIVGLIAGKLTEKYNKPTLVGTKHGDIVKGSARSINDIDITALLGYAKSSLLKFGGHAGAAGFTLDYNLKERFLEDINYYLNSTYSNIDDAKKLRIDAVLNLNDVHFDFIDKLEQLKPFGMNNEKPLLALMGLNLIDYKLVGKDRNHVKFSFKDNSGKYLNAIGFGKKSFIDLYPSSTLLDIAGTPQINYWNGDKYLDFNITDLRIAKK